MQAQTQFGLRAHAGIDGQLQARCCQPRAAITKPGRELRDPIDLAGKAHGGLEEMGAVRFFAHRDQQLVRIALLLHQAVADQIDLVLNKVLPENYWSTANDLNAVANGYAKSAFMLDLKNECARNPSCDAKKTAALTKLGSTVLDFTPVIGDIKAFVEAETPFDYLLATLGVTGPLGDSVAKALREGKALYKAGDIAGASGKLDEAKNIKDVNLANLVSPTN